LSSRFSPLSSPVFPSPSFKGLFVFLAPKIFDELRALLPADMEFLRYTALIIMDLSLRSFWSVSHLSESEIVV